MSDLELAVNIIVVLLVAFYGGWLIFVAFKITKKIYKNAKAKTTASEPEGFIFDLGHTFKIKRINNGYTLQFNDLDELRKHIETLILALEALEQYEQQKGVNNETK